MASGGGDPARTTGIFTQYIAPAIGLALAAIPAWDVLSKRESPIASMIAFVLWLVGAVLVVWSVRLNLMDAKRAQSLRAQLEAIKEEHKTELQRANQQLAEQTTRHADEIMALQLKHERDIREHRKIVIHSALWGMGGIQDLSSQDITSRLDYLLEQCGNQNVELVANDEFLGGGGYQGSPKKRLWVKFSCPCSTIAVSHTFNYGETVNLMPLCRHE